MSITNAGAMVQNFVSVSKPVIKQAGPKIATTVSFIAGNKNIMNSIGKAIENKKKEKEGKKKEKAKEQVKEKLWEKLDRADTIEKQELFLRYIALYDGIAEQ